jgi:hypothetical protein
MSGPQDQFKINLNQNLWGLVVGLSAMGAAEHYKLCTLFWFSVVVSAIMVLSLAVTTFVYTINYCKKNRSTTGKTS